MKPVDAHCHLEFESFDDDRKQVIRDARDSLEFIVNAGRNLESNRKALEMEEDNPGFIVPNLGLHPTHLEDFDDIEKIISQIREEKPAAVGEIGLDHHHVTSEEKRRGQREIFERMLDIAEELGKPAVIHSREAEKEVIETVQSYSIPGVMLHCFNGKPDLAKKAVDDGMLVGVTTQVLYSSRVEMIAKKLDLENLLLETDSPFLYRDDRNEPSNVVESAIKIADLKDMEVQEVVSKTTANARELFLQ